MPWTDGDFDTLWGRVMITEELIRKYLVVPLLEGKIMELIEKETEITFKQAWKDGGPILLEPSYTVEVTIPEDYAGDVMSDISSHRGKVEGMSSEGPFQLVRAKIPLAELYKYSTALRSMTQGRATHSRSFSHYEPVPHEIFQKIVADAVLEEEEED